MSQGGDGIHHLSWGVTVAENLSMGVNQGNYYVLGGYGKFFLHRGVFLFTGIAQFCNLCWRERGAGPLRWRFRSLSWS